MKGTTTMSLTKRALPEDIDVTDPRDTGNYGETELPDENELSIGWGMFDMNSTITRLEQHSVLLGVNPDELRAYADRLVDLALKIEKPF